MKHFLIALTSTLFLFLSTASAQAVFFLNGDFESGDTGWGVREDFFDVVSSPLFNVLDDGTGNNVGELATGFSSDFVTTIELVRNIGTLDANATSLLFDFRLIDDGPDVGSGGPIIEFDSLSIFLLTDIGDINPILTADLTGITVNDPGTSVSTLSNGYTRATVDVSTFQGATNAELLFDLFDADDERLALAQIDNLDLQLASTVIPEPTTLALWSFGLMGTLLWKKIS